MDISPAQESTYTIESSSHKQSTSNQTRELGPESVPIEPSRQKCQVGCETIQYGSAEVSETTSNCSLTKEVGPIHLDATSNSNVSQVGPPRENPTMNSSIDQVGPGRVDALNISNTDQVDQIPDDSTANSVIDQVGTQPEDAPEKSAQAHMGSPANNLTNQSKPKLFKRKYTPRSVIPSTRVLRSSSHEKPRAAPEPLNDDMLDVGVSKQMKRKKKKRMKKTLDEFSRIRKHLRYLLNRIAYEQSLIDAYSGEGWKGQSIEKLKPEKELQRAKSEIMHRKLKIRDLFQRLDFLSSQGRFPRSLFDSEGQLSSEDIYCAKCGSKDLSLDNDIILCDGACDRGFHQFCLEPPLLKEQIPPDDEGWLCPGCDCKVDCFDLLNVSQGTSLSITDSWEKVFPEAAEAVAKEGDTVDLPSDDSEDQDYDPEDMNFQRNKSNSSDESDFSSASSDASVDKKQDLGLPSDDSEDNDYDPDVQIFNDEEAKQESSSSDFTSDSEDLGAALDDARSALGKDEGPLSSPLDEDDFVPGSSKRNIERLDYKKLYDETYGNGPSDSSEDEDWTDGTVAPRRRNIRTPIIKNSEENTNYKNEHTPMRREKFSFEEDTSSALAQKGASPQGSSCKRASIPGYRKLGEAVVQRLYQYFKLNPYPDRGVKENLAKELGLEVKQVSKWFENTRWFSRYPSGKKSSGTGDTVPTETRLSELYVGTKDAICNGSETKEAALIKTERQKEPVKAASIKTERQKESLKLQSRGKKYSPRKTVG